MAAMTTAFGRLSQAIFDRDEANMWFTENDTIRNKLDFTHAMNNLYSWIKIKKKHHYIFIARAYNSKNFNKKIIILQTFRHK